MEPEVEKESSQEQGQEQVQQDTGNAPQAESAMSDAFPQEAKTAAPSSPLTPPEAVSEEPKTSSGKKISPKTIVLLLISLVVVIAAGVGVYLYMQSKNKPVPLAQVLQATPTPFAFKAKVQYLTGSAYKLVDERKVEILEGDILDEGDIIETGEDTRLVISFDEGSVLRVDAESRITLSKMTSPLSSVAQESGNVFYRVNKDEEHKFEVLAGEVIIESLGTAYSVEKQDDVKVKVFESKVKVLAEETETEVGEDQEWNDTSKEVTEIDSEEIADSEFYNWSLTEEKLISPTVTPTPKPVATAKPAISDSYKIKAYAKKVAGGIEITWESSVDSPKGYKVIKNLTGNPSYPGDNDLKYLNDPNARSVVWDIKDGKTWHFRVCQYLGGSCGEYSNDVVITADGNTGTGSVSSISLGAEKSKLYAKLTWSAVGTAANGFKVVWSVNPDPTYPPRDGDSVSVTTSYDRTLGPLEEGKTYYFRVCEYLGSGACGTYSNQATLSF